MKCDGPCVRQMNSGGNIERVFASQTGGLDSALGPGRPAQKGRARSV